MGLSPNGPVFYYNPEWADDPARTDREFAAVFEHEAAHLIHGDIPAALRRIAYLAKPQKLQVMQLMNLAMDAANNDILAEHPKLDLRNQEFAQRWVYSDAPIFGRATPKQSWAHYFSLLLKMLENERGNDPDDEPAQGDGQGDAQGAGNESSGNSGAQGSSDGKNKGNNKGGWDKSSLHKMMEQTNHSHMWMKAAEEMLNEAQITGDPIDAQINGMAEMANDAVRQAAQQHKKQCGSVPARFAGALAALETEDTQVPWQAVFQQVMSSAISTERRPDTDAPRRRVRMSHGIRQSGEVYELKTQSPLYPGRTRQDGYNVLVTLDTSGSMSNDEIAEVLATVQNLLTTVPGAALCVIQVDMYISNAYVMSPEQSIADYVAAVGRTSAGGTHFDAPFDLQRALCGMANEEELRVLEPTLDVLAQSSVSSPFDIIVYLTDAYGAVTSHDPGVPVVWVITKSGSESPSFLSGAFGTIVRMT